MRQPTMLLAVCLAASIVSTGQSAAAPAGADARSSTVTLISGDRVTLHGESTAVSPGPGRERLLFHRRTHGGRVHVIPDDALPLLADKRVDLAFFDVTGLIEGATTTRARTPSPCSARRRARRPCPCRRTPHRPPGAR